MLSTSVYFAFALALAAAAARWVWPVPWRVRWVLALLPLAFSGEALLSDRVWAPVDLAYNSAPLSGVRAELGIEKTAPGIYTDIWSQIVPWRQAVRHAFALGEWPLWNPFILCGDVLAGAAQAAPFYPLYLATLWLPLPLWLGVQASLALFLGALAAWLFFADLGLGDEAALVGAAGWTFCSAVIFWIHWPVGVATALFPLALLGARRVVREPGPPAAVLLGLACVLLLTSGHPETALHVVALAALWAGIEWLLERPAQPLRAIASGLGGGLVAVALAAVALLPILEALPQTAEYRMRREYFAHADRSVELPDAARHAVVQVAPFVYGVPGQAEPKVPAEWGLPGTAYAGSLLFAPALYALWRGRDRRRWAWLGLGLFGLLAGVQAPGVADGLAKLPLFDVALNERLIFVAGFAMASLAAYGLEAWSARRPRELGWLSLACAAALAAVAAALWPGLLHEGLPPEFLVPRAIAWIAPPLLLGLLLLARPAARVGLVAALALLAVQRQAEMGGLFPVRSPATFYPRVAPLDHLRPEATPYRVIGQSFALVPATGAMYGLEDARGYEAMSFARLTETFPIWCRRQGAWFNRIDDLGAPFLDFLNVRYALTSRKVAAPPGWQAVAGGRNSILWQNSQALERAFVPPHVRLGGRPERVLAEMAAARDFRRLAWIEDPAAPATAEPRPERNGPGRVAIAARGLGYHLSARLRSEGWVVVSVTAWRGWRALSEGRELPLAFANHAFLALRVPAGEHEIDLAYRPRSFALGGAVTLSTAAGLLAWAGVAVRRRRRAGAPRAVA